MLILSMLILPLQNAWAMMNTTSCDMTMSSQQVAPHEMSNQAMDTHDCCDHAALSMDVVDQSNSEDCCDSDCTNCSHVLLLMPIDITTFSDNSSTFIIASKKNLLGHLPYPALPPPIIS
jgi:hypothetical protein